MILEVLKISKVLGFMNIFKYLPLIILASCAKATLCE